MSVSPAAKKENGAGLIKSAKHGQEKRMRQIEEYVTWINSHLKKSGAVPISDLTNLLDGVSLVSLVEILGQCEVEGAEASPNTDEARVANLEKVVRHLKERGVFLPESTLRDLKEFNTKGVLRMVLALAKHYNPHSIRPSHHQHLSSPYTPSPSSTPVHPTTPDTNHHLLDPPPDHAPPLAEHLLSRPARSPWKDPPSVAITTASYRPNSTPLSMTTTPRTFVHQGRPTPLLMQAQHGGGGSGIRMDPPHAPGDPISSGGVLSPVSSPAPPPPPPRGVYSARDTPISGMTGVVSSGGLMRYTDSMISPPTGSSGGGDLSPALPPTHYLAMGGGVGGGETPVDQLEGALGQVGGLKGDLLQLFTLLRENPDGCSDEDLPELSQSVSELLSSTNHSQLTPLPEEVPELERFRDEVSQLHSECVVLQSMVDGKEDMVRQLKSDILRLDYKSETEREELRNIISEKQLVIEELDLRLTEKEKLLSDHAGQMADMEAALTRLRKAEEEHLQLYECKVSELQELKQTSSVHRSSSRLLHPELVSTEAEVIRISLGSLRRECSQAQQGSLDHLEQSVARLMDHLSSFTKPTRRHDPQHRTKEEHQRERKHKKTATPEEPSKVYGTMKVIFFMENDATPYRINMQLRNPSGPVLADFKRSLGKKGSFKYFFRASEEGAVVKVELSNDSEQLPMVDGKVMAWVYSS